MSRRGKICGFRVPCSKQSNNGDLGTRNLLTIAGYELAAGCACRRVRLPRPPPGAPDAARALDRCAALAREELWMGELGFVRADAGRVGLCPGLSLCLVCLCLRYFI